MRKALSLIGKIISVLLAAVALFLLVLFVYNRIRLAGERKLLANQQISQMVDVDGHRMSISVSSSSWYVIRIL